MEYKNFVPLIRQAQNGDQQALLELFLDFEPLIIKHACEYKKRVDEDCYQELAAQFIFAVLSFDLNRYVD